MQESMLLLVCFIRSGLCFVLIFIFLFYLRDQDRLGFVEARRAAKAVLLVAHGGVVPNIDKSHDVI
jgi:hypothetical protein